MSELIRKVMERSCSEFAEIPAVRWLEKKDIRERSYKELGENITLIRKGLLSEGFGGSRIAFVGGSSVWWVESYLGAVTGNMTAVPLDAGMPAEELAELINRSDCTGLFIDEAKKDLIPEFSAKCPALKKVWLLNGEAGNAETLAVLMDNGRAYDGDAGSSPDDTAMIIFTSGTTGKSKGAMLSQNNLAANLEAMSFASKPGVVLLNVLPIHHAFCLVMDWLRGFDKGAVICVNDNMMHLVRNMGIFRPHAMLMVPLMIETILKRIDAVKEPVSKPEAAQMIFGGRLRYIFTGGAHLDDYYLERFREFDIKILEGYGMSECSPVISANTPVAYKYGSVGKPLPNMEVKIAENGEILVRGSSVMKEYYNMPAETAAAIVDGWLHTGDKGYIDEDGYIFINGRIKNLIILSNGENVSPEEIENKLGVNDLIGEVVIVGENNGLTAVVYPDPDAVKAGSLDEEGIRNGIQAFLDEYNKTQPTYRHIVGLRLRETPFEKTASRKIKRDRV
ncbi:MAG: AMP-binding protein [Ruminiclostridium sp.]|nr:AMP-binding protein [Ruminiclostridium sp.]